MVAKEKRSEKKRREERRGEERRKGERRVLRAMQRCNVRASNADASRCGARDRGDGCGEERRETREGESMNDSPRSPRDENFMLAERALPFALRPPGVTGDKTQGFQARFPDKKNEYERAFLEDGYEAGTSCLYPKRDYVAYVSGKR